ncbi:MAG: CpaF family protein [Burkholderiales bacterium]|nr:CpaF family protein [Burkholderiales bacterium]
MNSKVQTALGFLQPIRHLMDDAEVTEIMVNGPDQIWVKRFGRRPERVQISLSEMQIKSAITMLASVSQRQVGDETASLDKAKIVSAGIPGFRFEAWMPPVAVNGPAFTARKLASKLIPLEQYVEEQTFTLEAGALLRDLVLGRRNVLVSGATGSGKTTLCNALLQIIPTHERLLVIQTISELIVNAPNKVLLESDEEQGYSISRILTSCLRGIPDRIIVGEVRGAEAYGLIKAFNTGHPGGIATLHANSALDSLERLEDMVMEGRPEMPMEAIRHRLAKAKPYLVFMDQVERKGRFLPTLIEITEVTGYQNGSYVTHPAYTYKEAQ